MSRWFLVLAASIVFALSVTASATSRRSDRDRSPERRDTSVAPAILPGTVDTRGPRTLRLASAAMETTYFGGTAWAPDSMRWEALRDSVWTFDTGVGSHFDSSDPDVQPYTWPKHARMEGWVGRIPGYPWPPDDPKFRRMTVSDFGAVPCVGSPAGLGGAASFWLGLTQAEADLRLYPTGQGYGNSWSGDFDGVERTFVSPGTGNVTLSFDYVCQIEPGFDYVYVEVDTSGTGYFTTVKGYTGPSSGHESLVLARGGALPSGPGPFTLRFSLWADGSYSDQDGYFPTTCGAFAFDNVSLAGAMTAGPFTFETDAEGWMATVPPASWDRSDIQALSGLPAPGTSPCALSDSVLVFFNGERTDDVALSPWIDLERTGVAGRPGKFIEADLFWEPVGFYELVVIVLAQWTPYGGHPVLSSLTGEERTYVFGSGDFCSPPGAPVRFDVSSLIDQDAKEIRIAVGQRKHCMPLTSCVDTTKSVYFDNIRFGVYGPVTGVAEPAPGVAARLLAPSPNPSAGPATFRFSLPGGESRPVALRLYDVAGRLVRELTAGPFAPGEHAVIWNGRDDAGLTAVPGLYFLRLNVDGTNADTRKIVRIR